MRTMKSVSNTWGDAYQVRFEASVYVESDLRQVVSGYFVALALPVRVDVNAMEREVVDWAAAPVADTEDAT